MMEESIEKIQLKNEKTTIQFPGGEVLIKLLATKDFLLPHFTGAIIRGSLFSLLNKVDPFLSQILIQYPSNLWFVI